MKKPGGNYTLPLLPMKRSGFPEVLYFWSCLHFLHTVCRLSASNSRILSGVESSGCVPNLANFLSAAELNLLVFVFSFFSAQGPRPTWIFKWRSSTGDGLLPLWQIPQIPKIPGLKVHLINKVIIATESTWQLLVDTQRNVIWISCISGARPRVPECDNLMADRKIWCGILLMKVLLSFGINIFLMSSFTVRTALLNVPCPVRCSVPTIRACSCQTVTSIALNSGVIISKTRIPCRQLLQWSGAKMRRWWRFEFQSLHFNSY